jgi:hypothetical protein
MRKIIRFSNKENVEFNTFEKQAIEKNSNMAIFRGMGVTLKGWKEHNCDCDKCDLDYEDVEERFASKEEAEIYIEDEDIRDPEIEENSCYYIKAVEQLPANFGLFKEVI